MNTTIKLNLGLGKPFYTYLLLKPCGEVFYVGKGKGDRYQVHSREARGKSKVYNNYKINVIKKIWKSGKDFKVVFVSFYTNELDAFEEEKDLISIYHETLTNLTLGGEGTSGRKASEETRKRMSSSQRSLNRTIPEWHKDINRKAQLGNKQSKETVLKRVRKTSKLSDEQVREILKMLPENIRQQDIADKFKVDRTRISQINLNKAYTHVNRQGEI